MMNNFCLHLYAQKSLAHSLTLTLPNLSVFYSLIHSLLTFWTTFVLIIFIAIIVIIDVIVIIIIIVTITIVIVFIIIITVIIVVKLLLSTFARNYCQQLYLTTPPDPFLIRIPSQDLKYSLVLQVLRRSASLDQRFTRKLHIKFWKRSFFWFTLYWVKSVTACLV